MKHNYSAMCQRLPIRARVAFVLAVAERVLPALAKHVHGLHAAQAALSDAWQWEEGADIRALWLYKKNIEPLAIQGSSMEDGKASAAMCAVTAAYFYTLWHAFRLDLDRKEVRASKVPNDIADVSEDVIDEACGFAIETSLFDDQWIGTIYKRLASDFGNDGLDQLGRPVPRLTFRNESEG